jgi:hypothetical protein
MARGGLYEKRPRTPKHGMTSPSVAGNVALERAQVTESAENSAGEIAEATDPIGSTQQRRATCWRSEDSGYMAWTP